MGKKARSTRREGADTATGDALRAAMALQRQGQLAEAEAIYRQMLQRRPEDFNALHLLGLIRFQQRHLDEARDLIGRALSANPASADAQCNMGAVLRGLGRYDEAGASYRHALRVQPDHPTAHNGLGNVLMLLQRPEEATDSYRRAIAIRPDHAEAHNNLGNALNALGEPEAAAASFRQALALRPDFAEAHNNLGNVLKGLGGLEAALASYRRALAIRPDYADAHKNLGNTLVALNRLEDAVASFDRALAGRPQDAGAHFGRGDALAKLRRYEAAIASLRTALALRPDYAEAHARLAYAHAQSKDYTAAIAGYRQALAHRPDYPFALGALAEAQRHICDWSDGDTIVGKVRDEARAGRLATRPFALLTLSDDLEEQSRCARAYAQARFGTDPAPPFQGPAPAEARLRIAYLSADFHEHATAHLMAGLFERHDRDRFEVFALSFGPDDGSAMRTRLRNGFEHFIDVGRMSDVEVAQRISELGVHIAVDLKGYTQGARPGILRYRPAPIQVSYLGFPGTMGAGFIDYILVDGFTVPADRQPFFAERLVHLPGSYQVNDDRRLLPEHGPSRTDCGLPADGFVFCCFNNSSKITPSVFDLWMRLLAAVPASVLWLLDDTGAVARNLRREAQARGIDPGRLVFAPRCSLSAHLARHRAADLFLDTLPYNAHTTASDALWTGLPVLTCTGRSFQARVAGSLLHAVGLPELVTSSADDYLALALELANHPDRLGRIRDRLRENRTTAPLFDTDGTRRNIESAYSRMWRIWKNGEPASAFAVS